MAIEHWLSSLGKTKKSSLSLSNVEWCFFKVNPKIELKKEKELWKNMHPKVVFKMHISVQLSMHLKWNVNYSLPRKFKALQVKLFDLFGSKINTMGGLFQAPVQIQSHYIFIVSTFKSPFSVASTTAYGNTSQTHGNQHIIQTHLLHEPDSSDIQKIQAQQVKEVFACYISELYHVKHSRWTWEGLFLIDSQLTLQNMNIIFQL